ncbi:hypothetical protein [Actinophytocola sp.]|uniref:hypothetical protein n=1 Tax=Actinophytocola sp. TaxID=1872138 RepID=UPI003D6AF155
MKELDDFEDGLIERFRQHPVLRDIDRLSEDAFHDILLQRRFLSHTFTTVYDLAIDLLTDEQAIRIARVIIREEYPDDKSSGPPPSHREDMKCDILRLGVSWRKFVETRPSRETGEVISHMFSLLADSGAGEHANMKLVTILRFWGEILVSVEYAELWRRMEKHLMVNGENHSLFYYPHLKHDAKTRPLAEASPLSLTHSDQLGVRLYQLVGSAPDTWDSFREVESTVLGLKNRFYDQFVPAIP